MENIKESPVPPENQDPYLGYGVLAVERLTETAKLPAYGKEGDAALDLFVDSFEWKTDVSGNKKDLDPSVEEITLDFGDMVMVNFGIRTKPTIGFGGFLTMRSGFSTENGVSLVNAPGVIDTFYRGPIKGCLVKVSSGSCKIKKGERTCQYIPFIQIKMEVEEEEKISTNTVRGEGGFGHTGNN